jgi:hypothetical protein
MSIYVFSDAFEIILPCIQFSKNNRRFYAELKAQS